MFEISTFSCDITPPMGTPLCGGVIEPAKVIDDPQYALGFVLQGGGDPLVLAVMDWVGVYGVAHDQFTEQLADAANTSPQRVLLCSVHQHDAPWQAPDAQALLSEYNRDILFCDPNLFERTAQQVVEAMQNSLSKTERVTHVGLGRAQVRQVASNRRLLGADGKVAHMRNSRCYEPDIRAAPEGLIDPYLSALTFFNDDRPVLTMNHYATHPMSHYGHGHLSSDFCGLARARRLADDPQCLQVFVNGCAGNIGAGKYNDGSPEDRQGLIQRMYEAMTEASNRSERQPLNDVKYSHLLMRLPMREDPGFTHEDCIKALQEVDPPTQDYLDDAMRTGRIVQRDLRHSALALCWRKRSQEPINVPTVDLGVAKLVLLPGEPFIEFQLAAQQYCPDPPVIVIGYGNAGSGYLCTDIAYDQGGYEANLPAYTGRGTEAVLHQTLRQAVS